MADELRPMEAPITLEKTYLVGGKRVTFQVIFPASLGKDIGLENVYQCAQRVIVRADSKQGGLKELKHGE